MSLGQRHPPSAPGAARQGKEIKTEFRRGRATGGSTGRLWLWLFAMLGGAILGVALGRPEPVLSCGGCGGTVAVKFVGAFTNDDGVVNQKGMDPNDNGVDPGYEKMVASCRAWVTASGNVKVEVVNGYPSYTCRLWAKVRNTGTSAVDYVGRTIGAPKELTVRDVTDPSCNRIKPGGEKYLSFTVHVEQSARQRGTYTFEIKPDFKGAPCGW